MNSIDIRLEDTPFYDSELEKFDDIEFSDELYQLFLYPFQGKNELGNSLSKYNGATRVDVCKEYDSRIVRSPDKFLTVLRLFEREANVTPSYGLKVKKGSRYDYVHFILELNPSSSVGVFFYDSKRMLAVPQVHNVERLIQDTGLRGGIIIANNVGMPAKQEADRINKQVAGPGIITIEHYDSLEKRYLNG